MEKDIFMKACEIDEEIQNYKDSLIAIKGYEMKESDFEKLISYAIAMTENKINELTHQFNNL
jgi:hypothetical protein